MGFSTPLGPNWALQKNRSQTWFGTNGFQPVEDFLLEKIEAVSGNKESQKANTTPRPRWWIHHRNLWIPVPTPHLRKKNTTKIPSIKAVYFTVWEIKQYPNFHTKKSKPKIQGDKNRFRNGWIWWNSNQVSSVETQWHPWRLTSEGWNFPHHLHQRSAPFGLCRKPGHHGCVCVKPSSHHVLQHLPVMPGWGWTCPSQAGDLGVFCNGKEAPENTRIFFGWTDAFTTASWDLLDDNSQPL